MCFLFLFFPHLMADATAADPVFRNRCRNSRRRVPRVPRFSVEGHFFGIVIGAGAGPGAMSKVNSGIGPTRQHPARHECHGQGESIPFFPAWLQPQEPEPVFPSSSLEVPLAKKKLLGTAAGTGSRQHRDPTNAMDQRRQGSSIRCRARRRLRAGS